MTVTSPPASSCDNTGAKNLKTSISTSTSSGNPSKNQLEQVNDDTGLLPSTHSDTINHPIIDSEDSVGCSEASEQTLAKSIESVVTEGASQDAAKQKSAKSIESVVAEVASQDAAKQKSAKSIESVVAEVASQDASRQSAHPSTLPGTRAATAIATSAVISTVTVDKDVSTLVPIASVVKKNQAMCPTSAEPTLKCDLKEGNQTTVVDELGIKPVPHKSTLVSTDKATVKEQQASNKSDLPATKQSLVTKNRAGRRKNVKPEDLSKSSGKGGDPEGPLNNDDKSPDCNREEPSKNGNDLPDQSSQIKKTRSLSGTVTDAMKSNGVKDSASERSSSPRSFQCQGVTTGGEQCRKKGHEHQLEISDDGKVLLCSYHTAQKTLLQESTLIEWVRGRELSITAQIRLLQLMKKEPSVRDKRGFIYIFQNPTTGHPTESHLNIKIGRSINVPRRMKSIAKQCCFEPFQVEKFGPVDNYSRVERLIHLELKECKDKEHECNCEKKHSEWFNIPHGSDNINNEGYAREKVREVVKNWLEYMTSTTAVV